jgi:hypothetical protein
MPMAKAKVFWKAQLDKSNQMSTTNTCIDKLQQLGIIDN